MPYAPGIEMRAGEYFAAQGPRIAQNIQNWREGREERAQSIASAEMMAQYLKNDPRAMEMFGDKLSQIPKMSTAAAKAVLGGLTMYLNEKVQREREEPQRIAATLQADKLRSEIAYEPTRRAQEAALHEKQIEAARLTGDTARQKLLQDKEQAAALRGFSDQVANPPMMLKDSVNGPGGNLTGSSLVRAAARSRALGLPGVAGIIGPFENMAVNEAKLEAAKAETTRWESFGSKVKSHKGALTADDLLRYGADTGVVGSQNFGSMLGHYLDRPGTANLKPTEIKDSKGNVISYSVTDSKGGTRIIRPPTAAAGPGATGPKPPTAADVIRAVKDRAKLVAEVTKDLSMANTMPEGSALRLEGMAKVRANQKAVYKLDEVIKRWESQPAAASAPAPAAPEPEPEMADAGGGDGQVHVISPDGERGWISADQLKQALEEGYKEIDGDQ